MNRLGELLIAGGQLTSEQVEQALRAQVLWGGRIGTNLIEIGCIDLDTLSRTLGHQHHLPCALARHFERTDAQLQRLLSPDVAERYLCVPLVRVSEGRLVIAATGPVDERGLAIIATELGVLASQLIVSVAAELRIRYHLERAYQIPRGMRFLRSKGNKSFPKFQAVPIPVSEPELDIPIEQVVDVDIPIDIELQGQPSDAPSAPPVSDPIEELDDLSTLAVLDDEAVPVEIPPEDTAGRERRHYLRTLSDAPPASAEPPLAIGRIAVRRIAITAAPTFRSSLGTTLGEATRAIRRATDRDHVAALVIETLERRVEVCEAALVLVIRNEIAIGWRGYSRGGTIISELAVPLEHDGIVPRAIDQGTTARCPSDDLGAIDLLLLRALDREDGDLVVVPVTIGSEVMCLIATVTRANADISSVESIAVAAGSAFARLMRDASR